MIRRAIRRTRIGPAAEVALFLLPFAIFWILFRAGPVLYGFYISLFKWDLLGDVVFTGGRNYLILARDPRFWNALANTLKFAGMAIPLIVGIGLLLSLFVFGARHRRIGRWLEAGFFFPYLLTVSVVGLIWRWMMDPDFGILLIVLRRIGIAAPVFLNEPRWVIPALAFTTAWWLAGYRMVLFRAALEDIPDELYEAARIDGASGTRVFFSIVLPLLKPAVLFALVLTTISGFIVFGQVLIMTAGGPGRASEVLALYLYRYGFEFLEMGQAAAVGVVLFLIILGLTLLSFRWLGYEAQL